jgi:protein involved in polysaccharide export with SLBB domain
MIRLRIFVLFAVLVAGAQPSLAQVPTAEQLELLRSMNPEDRRALMEQLGLDASMIEGATGSTSSSGTDRKRPTTDSTRADDQMRLMAANDKSLKPDDSVLIDIDFKKDKPARLESQGEGLPPISIPAEIAPVFDSEVHLELEERINLIRSRNPYQLDSSGFLLLPGFGPILLAGLTEQQATHRLSAVGAFRNLDIKLTKLPLRKVGQAGLKPFGYELFKDSSSTFAPVGDVPVPSDYIVGPGDQLQVQLFGSQNRNLRLPVGRDGRISFPELGPIVVGGRSYGSVVSEIEARVARQMIGVRASVSMGDTRSIQVFVMGEVIRPGSYTVSGLSSSGRAR